jgi:hypothetical protein
MSVLLILVVSREPDAFRVRLPLKIGVMLHCVKRDVAVHKKLRPRGSDPVSLDIRTS